MVRTQIYLTEIEKSGIEFVAHSRGISQSDCIRQAIDQMLQQNTAVDKISALEEIAGVWSDRTDTPDLRELRAGWRERPVR